MEDIVYTNALMVTAWCKSIANTFTPDDFVVRAMLYNDGIDPAAVYSTTDKISILKVALELVQGHVKTLDIEGDVHQDTYWQGVKANIIRISNKYGLNPEEYIAISSVSDASRKF